MIEKAYYCQRYIENSKLFPHNHRPVWYTEGDNYFGRTTKVFVSATFFNQWSEWKRRADEAITAATIEFDFFNGRFEKRGSSYPIVASPQYLLEKSPILPDGYEVFVNALCPNESEFLRVVAEAEERIADRRKPLSELRVASFGEPLPMLPIASSEFQDGRRDDVRALIDAL